MFSVCKMKFLFSLLYITLYTVSYGFAEHETDHTENPSISLDYDTVTQIIEALTDPESEAEDQTTEVVLEVTPSPDAVADYIYSKQDSFQKRKSPSEPETRRQRRQKIVISSHVIDMPDDDEEIGVEPHYFPDEPVDPEDDVLSAPCDTQESIYETLDSSVETAGESHGFVGSLKGTPGVDYPNYSEIPLTSFTCADKKHIPGFYADIETRCQVFHVCYPHRRESFLCPVGTTFNQPIKACDYWYNGNCSASAGYFEETLTDIPEEDAEEVLEIIKEVFPEEKIPEKPDIVEIPVELPQPVVVPIPKPVVPQPVVVPVPKPIIIEPVVAKPPVVLKPDPLSVKVVAMKKFLPVKAKVVKFAAPVVAAKAKIVAAKAPVIAKTLPIIKLLKVAPVKKAVAKKVVLKSAAVAAPVLAKKAVAKKVVLKSAAVAAPVLAKKAVAKKILLTKVAKAKAAKVIAKKVAISALTKKHIALSLLRMARGHKVGLHGVRRRPVYYV